MQLEQLPSPRNILLYGYGAEGRSSEAWLKQHCPQAEIEVYEDRPPSNSPQQGESKIEWDRYDMIVKSPGVPPSRIPDEYWPKVTSNLRLFLENLTEVQRQKIIGITGSKGKSTTAKFCHELLQTAGFNSTIIGNYGVPALDMWDQLEALDYLVAECSSFQLYDLKVSPHYAIFLSFFADHLDWHNGSKIDYFAAKQNLWGHQTSSDYLFVPQVTAQEQVQLLTPGQRVETQAVPADFFPPDSTLQAEHFRQNLGPVWALAQQLKVDDLPSVWQRTAAGFAMIEHRLEKFATLGAVQFYNDSIATSPDATIKAVEWLGRDLAALILDGQDTGVEGCAQLVKTIQTCAPQTLIVLIESDIATAFAASASGQNLTTKTFPDYPTAVAWIQAKVSSGAVLFSPGGKSFNRFKNYAERGKVFKNLVLGLS